MSSGAPSLSFIAKAPIHGQRRFRCSKMPKIVTTNCPISARTKPGYLSLPYSSLSHSLLLLLEPLLDLLLIPMTRPAAVKTAPKLPNMLPSSLSSCSGDARTSRASAFGGLISGIVIVRRAPGVPGEADSGLLDVTGVSWSVMRVCSFFPLVNRRRFFCFLPV